MTVTIPLGALIWLVPVTCTVPVWLTLPLALLASKLPVAETVPSVRLVAAASEISPPSAMTAAPKVFVVLSRVMLPLVEASVLAPVAAMLVPLAWVMSFTAVAPKVPLATILPSVSAFASFSATLAPVAFTAPTKLLVAFDNVMSVAAASVLAPVAAILLPLACVIAPAVEVAANVPLAVMLPNCRLASSLIVTLAPLAPTDPPKVFAAVVMVTLPEPAPMSALVPMDRVLPPACTTSPFAATSSVPVVVMSPSVNPLLSARLTFTPLAFTVPKLLVACARVMLPLVEVSVVTPAAKILDGLACVMSPVTVTSNVPLEVTLPRLMVSTSASVRLTLLAFTVPKLLVTLDSVMSPVVEANVATPVATKVVPAVCVSAPGAVTPSVPPALMLPSITPPAACAMPALPPTATVPLVPVWVKLVVTVKLPPFATLPPFWLKFATVTLPAPPNVPPVCVRPAKFRLVVTFITPPAIDMAPVVPLMTTLSRLTAPVCAGATTVPALLKLTFTPSGMTTFATFAKSGTAPPAQLAGSNQLPVVPPVQATDDKRVILAVALLGATTL